MNKTKIEWTNYTWNPVTGCLHDCPYCYARRIAMRFQGHFNPTFHADRLSQPYKLKKPSKIFVGSMCDLFGEWVKKDWIDEIIEVVCANPQHIFQFLTKNPKRYSEFNFPVNCWLGMTMDYPNKSKLQEFKKKGMNYKFISFEPLRADMSELDLTDINLCIVGADTSPGANPPKQEWIKSIKHKNIFYKKNIKQFIKVDLINKEKNNQKEE